LEADSWQVTEFVSSFNFASSNSPRGGLGSGRMRVTSIKNAPFSRWRPACNGSPAGVVSNGIGPLLWQGRSAAANAAGAELRTSPERFIEDLAGDTAGNNGRGVVRPEDGIAVGQAELCHNRPHTSKSAPAKWLRDWAGRLYRSRSCLELGITDAYFVAIPRDPSDAEAERLLAELRFLAQDAR
jgi:hypothetical protein